MKIVIEEYIEVDNGNKFMLPPIPWKWTVYQQEKVLGFGYTYSEEDANSMANKILKDRA